MSQQQMTGQAAPRRHSFIKTLLLVLPSTVVVLLLINFPAVIHHRRGVWWIDSFSFWLWTVVGTVLGLLLAPAIWYIRSQQPPRSAWLHVFTWWFIGAATGLVLGIGTNNLFGSLFQITAGRDGSGGPALMILFLIIVAVMVVLGSIIGVVWGTKCVRKWKNASLNQADS